MYHSYLDTLGLQCSNLEDWKSDFFVNVYFSAILNMVMENIIYQNDLQTMHVNLIVVN